MINFNKDIFEPEFTFKLEEANDEIDGKHVLGKLKGEFFVPDGVSRNNRYYPKSLWEKVVSDPILRKKMDEKRMFGTISHEQGLDDKALLDGKISHIVTDLRIEGGKGIGEAIILNTPAGQILNTVLRAGTKLFVSSRADGAFKGEVNGIPRVDPDHYLLTGFDVVIDPGFLQANPQLVESLKQTFENINKSLKSNEGENMEPTTNSQSLLEKVVRDNTDLKSNLDKALVEVQKLTADIAIMASANSNLKAISDKLPKVRENLSKYADLGSPDEVAKALAEAEKIITAYKALGSVKSITEALDKATKRITEYKDIGSVREINSALDKSIAVVESYKELGTPVEIKEAFTRMEKTVGGIKENKAKLRIAELAKELNVSEENIRKVYGKLTEKDIKDLFSKVQESNNLSNKYINRSPVNEKKTSASTSKGPKAMDESAGKRLMGAFVKPSAK